MDRFRGNEPSALTRQIFGLQTLHGIGSSPPRSVGRFNLAANLALYLSLRMSGFRRQSRTRKVLTQHPESHQFQEQLAKQPAATRASFPGFTRFLSEFSESTPSESSASFPRGMLVFPDVPSRVASALTGQGAWSAVRVWSVSCPSAARRASSGREVGTGRGVACTAAPGKQVVWTQFSGPLSGLLFRGEAARWQATATAAAAAAAAAQGCAVALACEGERRHWTVRWFGLGRRSCGSDSRMESWAAVAVALRQLWRGASAQRTQNMAACRTWPHVPVFGQWAAHQARRLSYDWWLGITAGGSRSLIATLGRRVTLLTRYAVANPGTGNTRNDARHGEGKARAREHVSVERNGRSR